MSGGGRQKELMDRGDITVGGIVTNVRESMTKKGKPCGFVMLEDFEGSGEIALSERRGDAGGECSPSGHRCISRHR